MHRRKFLTLFTGAVAAVVGVGKTLSGFSKPVAPEIDWVSAGPPFRNYTDQYAKADKAELIAKMRAAKAKMDFQPPLGLYDQPPRFLMATPNGLYWVDPLGDAIPCTFPETIHA